MFNTLPTLLLGLSLALTLLGSNVFAQSTEQQNTFKNSQQFERYTVHYNVFNSTFVTPEVAAIYKIKRSPYESLINVSVSRNGEYGGVPVEIKGTSKNLMQQFKPLKFLEIKEENAVYYIAPIRVGREDILHLTVEVTPEGEPQPLVTTITKTVYAD